MNNFTTKQVWHSLKSVLLTGWVLLLISCESSRNTQSNNAPLKNEKSELMQEVLKEKFDEGIDFFATSSDSSWTLSMDFEKDFKFRSVDGFTFSTPAVMGLMVPDSSVLRFHAQVESGEMIIEMYQEECIHSTTGLKFLSKVRVEVRRGIDKEFMIFQGCGIYIFDQRIHDIWVLHILHNNVVSGKELPYIEFNTTDGTVLGNTGCNNFSGKASLMGNKLTLNPLAVTRKFCPEVDLEGEFLKAISPGEMVYKIEEGKLFLYRNDEEVIVFRKVD
jgi:heat shock protein HslJ